VSLAIQLANTPDDARSLVEWVCSAGAEGIDESTLRSLRAAVRDVLEAAIGEPPVAATSVAVLNETAAAAPSYPQLEAGELAYVFAASPDAAFVADVAADAIELAGGPRRPLLRLCRAPGCFRLFVASRPRQTWCSDACGTRARVARSRAA
jgi:predicted RNA-binding Zn ribbon-like protein